MRIFFALLLAGSQLLAHAQAPLTLIKAGMLFDSEKKQLLPNQQILVEGNTIKEVGPNLVAPAGATIIDLSAYTVMPGIIESHMHMLYLEPMGGDLTRENLKMITMEGDALRTLRAAKRARTFLDAGITTVKDLGNSGQFLDVALKTAIAEGTVQGPRMFVSGPIISSVGGQLPGIRKEYHHLAEQEYRVVKDVEDARLAVRENITYGADLIKITADNTPNNTSLSLEQMKAIVETAHRYNKKVTAHATGARATWEAIMAGVDGIEHGYSLPDSIITLMAQKGTYLVPTDLTADLLVKYSGAPREEISQYLKDGQHKRLQAAIKAGVKIVSGSDCYVDFKMPQGDAAKQVLIAYHEAGMAPLDILQACTKTAAAFLQQPDKLGVIKKGALADIIAMDGDIEKNFPQAIMQTPFVMADGKVVKQPGK